MHHRPIPEMLAHAARRPVRAPEDGAADCAPLPALLTSGGDRETDEGPGLRAVDVGLKRARLLVVEDDWFVGMDIEAALLDSGYDVVGLARSADEAVRAATGLRPDLVLMDIRLVGPRDGIEAAWEIRQRADIPCLFISAHTDAPTRARAANTRPAGWLMKPFLTHHLLQAVERALGAGGDESDPA